MSKINIDERVWVWCDFEQAPTTARVLHGDAFCTACGQTDHQRQNADGTFTTTAHNAGDHSNCPHP
jgi:hypothetical protein